jgi:spore coat polysaccharide biosynthesis protein SpsF
MELEQTILVSQARSGSTRLPKKVLLKIQGQELLNIQLTRLHNCKEIDKIIIATTTDPEDDAIASLCKSWDVTVSRGQINDVLDRYYQAVLPYKPKWVVRVTSDCPLIDPELVDALVKFAKVNEADYASNILEERFPDGQDVEVFKFEALEKAWKEAELLSEREHVTPYLRKNCTFNGGKLFSSANFSCVDDFSDIRMTVDETRDFDMISKLIDDLGTKESWLTYTRHIILNKYNKINSNIIRNEGMLKSLKDDQIDG